MRGLVILLLVPGFSLGLVAGVTHLVGPLDTVSAEQTSLVWSNRVFTTRSDFAGWLVSRGSNYELWSQRHPAAARHFDDVSRRSLAATSSAQDYVQSRTALLITIISCSALLALLTLPRIVRSARFLLDPPKSGLRLRGPPLRVPAMERARAKTHPSYAPTSALIEGTARFDWHEGWGGLCRLARVTADRAAEAATFDSWVVRRYLPRVVFYTTAVVLSFAIGAWVAIYL